MMLLGISLETFDLPLISRISVSIVNVVSTWRHEVSRVRRHFAMISELNASISSYESMTSYQQSTEYLVVSLLEQ